MKRSATAPSTATDSVLRSIVESEEYKAALKTRMLAGKATSAELSLARDLGMVVPQNDGLDGERDAMRAMDKTTRRRLTDMLRLMRTPDGAARFRCIDAPGVIGIGYVNAVPVDQTTPTPDPPQTEDVETLLPPRTA